jgi:hypothetical protein
MHPFEKSGLGKAPFRCVGFSRKIGPIRRIEVINGVGVEVMIGAPGQPMGACQHCGQGIADCFEIRSADGKTFIVGSDCVGKTNGEYCDPLLTQTFTRQKSALARMKRQEKAAADYRFIAEVLDRPDFRARLEAEPSFRDRNLYESFRWHLDHSGAAGLGRLAAEVRRRLRVMEGVE